MKTPIFSEKKCVHSIIYKYKLKYKTMLVRGKLAIYRLCQGLITIIIDEQRRAQQTPKQLLQKGHCQQHLPWHLKGEEGRQVQHQHQQAQLQWNFQNFQSQREEVGQQRLQPQEEEVEPVLVAEFQLEQCSIDHQAQLVRQKDHWLECYMDSLQFIKSQIKFQLLLTNLFIFICKC